MPVTKKNRLNRASKAHNKTIRTSKSKRSKKRSSRKKSKRSKKRSSRKKSKRSSRKKSKKGNSHIMKGGGLLSSDINALIGGRTKIEDLETNIKNILKPTPLYKNMVFVFIKGFDGKMDNIEQFEKHIITKIKEILINKEKVVILVWDGDKVDNDKFTRLIYIIFKDLIVDAEMFKRIMALGFKINEQLGVVTKLITLNEEMKKDGVPEEEKKKLQTEIKEKEGEKSELIRTLNQNLEKIGISQKINDNITDLTKVDTSIIGTIDFFNTNEELTSLQRSSMLKKILYVEVPKEKIQSLHYNLRRTVKIPGPTNYLELPITLDNEPIFKSDLPGFAKEFYLLAQYAYCNIQKKFLKSAKFSSNNSLFIFYGGGGIACNELKSLIKNKRIEINKSVFYYPISRNRIEQYPTAGDYFINNLPNCIVHSVDGISNPNAILAYSSNIHEEFMENYKETFKQMNLTTFKQIKSLLESTKYSVQLKKNSVVDIITEYLLRKTSVRAQLKQNAKTTTPQPQFSEDYQTRSNDKVKENKFKTIQPFPIKI